MACRDSTEDGGQQWVFEDVPRGYWRHPWLESATAADAPERQPSGHVAPCGDEERCAFGVEASSHEGASSRGGAGDSAALEKKNLEELEEQDAAQWKASEAASGDKSSSETCGWSDVEAEQMKEMLEWAEVIEAEYRRSREFDAFSMKASSGGRPSSVSEPDSLGVRSGPLRMIHMGGRKCCGNLLRHVLWRGLRRSFFC